MKLDKIQRYVLSTTVSHVARSKEVVFEVEILSSHHLDLPHFGGEPYSGRLNMEEDHARPSHAQSRPDTP